MARPTATQIQAAKDRGIIVQGKDGADPTAEDYVVALSAPPDKPPLPDARVSGEAAAAAATPPKSSFDETIPGGRYVNTAGKLVNSFGQEINDDGSLTNPDEQPKTGAQPFI